MFFLNVNLFQDSVQLSLSFLRPHIFKCFYSGCKFFDKKLINVQIVIANKSHFIAERHSNDMEHIEALYASAIDFVLDNFFVL